MIEPPFSLTPEAEAWLASRLAGAMDLPELAAAIPIFIRYFGYRASDQTGRPTEAFDGEHFEIGWDRPASDLHDGYLPLAICGRAVLAAPSDLDELQGVVLTAVRVDVGVPDPRSVQRYLLVRAPGGRRMK